MRVWTNQTRHQQQQQHENIRINKTRSRSSETRHATSLLPSLPLPTSGTRARSPRPASPPEGSPSTAPGTPNTEDGSRVDRYDIAPCSPPTATTGVNSQVDSIKRAGQAPSCCFVPRYSTEQNLHPLRTEERTRLRLHTLVAATDRSATGRPNSSIPSAWPTCSIFVGLGMCM